jgi:DivIVA domain-containing protein
MPLTPADVANVAFGKPAMGKRGYHEDEVDTFLDIVHAELTRLIHDNDELRSQLDQLHQQLTTRPADPAGDAQSASPPVEARATGPAQPGTVPAVPEDNPHVRAAKILTLAQQLADKITAEATADTEQMLTQAHRSCQQLLSEATAQAEDLVAQASTRTETLLTEARNNAETLDQQAQDKAAALERQAMRQHAEILGALRQQKSVLEKKIDQLRTFEHDLRTRLASYLHSQLDQLRQLDQSQPTPPPDPIPQPPDPAPSKPGAQPVAASRP